MALKKKKNGSIARNDFPGGSVVKSLPAMRETWIQSLGQGDPLETEMATHSSTLAWEIPREEEPGSATVHGITKVLDMTEWLNNSS